MGKDKMSEHIVELSPSDRKILASYRDFVDGLSDYLGSGYEFVLHSLDSLEHSVIKIINGHYTGRKEGAPITDLALKMLSYINRSKSDSYKSYFTRNAKGIPMKSTTIGINGERGNIIGLLCINYYLDTPISDMIQSYIPQPENESMVKELYATNIDELVSNVVLETQAEVFGDDSISAGKKNWEIVKRLDSHGYFSLKDSVPYAATCMGISKNTIYMHLRRLQKDSEDVKTLHKEG